MYVLRIILLYYVYDNNVFITYNIIYSIPTFYMLFYRVAFVRFCFGFLFFFFFRNFETFNVFKLKVWV